MELTRRDALAALSAAGAGSLAGCSAGADDGGAGGESGAAEGPSPVGEHELATLVAVAEVVYPSAAENVGEFVRTYTGGRVDGDGAYAEGVAAAVDTLDGYTAAFHGTAFAELSAADRRQTLDHMSVDAVDPAPRGTDAQRVRHFLVNELLYAFYTSPAGAGLAGLENPPGHPGGRESYTAGPDR